MTIKEIARAVDNEFKRYFKNYEKKEIEYDK